MSNRFEPDHPWPAGEAEKRLLEVLEYANEITAWRLVNCRACWDKAFAKDHPHDCGITRLDVDTRLREILGFPQKEGPPTKSGEDEAVRKLERGEIENLLNVKLEDWQWARISDFVWFRAGDAGEGHEDVITARWVDIEDPKEQFEAAFGIKLEKWQWDYIQHLRRGERLVPHGRRGSRWIKDMREL